MKLISSNDRDFSARKPVVLAVDDYEPNLVALQAVLGDENQMICVGSGEQAIEILKSNQQIDVVLLDIQMPDLDGYQTAAEIKSIPGHEDIPIVFITAVYKEDPFVKQGYAAGGVDYFSKPFDPEILKTKVGIYASFRQRAEVLRQRELHIKASEELVRIGRRLSTALESLPVGVLISDSEGQICQLNQHVATICDRFHPADPESYGAMLGWWDAEGRLVAKSGPLADALREGKVSHSQTLQIIDRDGKQKSVLCSASPLLGLAGDTVGAVIALQDITESKKIEADLEDRITRVAAIGI
ncbi:MAG: response regulator [Bdellovibrionota bacterium]